jgi:hypothetical protein
MDAPAASLCQVLRASWPLFKLKAGVVQAARRLTDAVRRKWRGMEIRFVSPSVQRCERK